MQPGARVVGRLAPSPTGALHIGHARTFLIAWWMVRVAGGKMILRIEDLDSTRTREGMAELTVTDLRWLGLDWDEGPDVGGPNGPYFQSQRTDRYSAILERLKQERLVYPCTCTRADILRAATAPHAEDEGPIYAGTCANRSPDDANRLEQPYAWRLRVPNEPIGWNDLFRGPREFNLTLLGGDFVVGRSDGSIAYQLAVVADDAAMGVNQVVRGDDLIPSTPRQILLYRALGFPVPDFGHVPLVVDADGRRLAKRDDSIKLSKLREQGIKPSQLIQTIARSCRMDDNYARASDYIERFEPSLVPIAPCHI
jgi:glutamyl-tRNA synthetase